MTTKNVASEFIEAMREAAEIAQGNAKPARVTTFRPSIALDVRQIRVTTGLSRTEFARKYALDARALQDWEQGRRKPDKAARAYLKVIAKQPKAVEKALAS